MSGPFIGDFAHSNQCVADDCEDPAVRTLVYFDVETEEMIVCHLCLAHTLHHKMLFEERAEN